MIADGLRRIGTLIEGGGGGDTKPCSEHFWFFAKSPRPEWSNGDQRAVMYWSTRMPRAINNVVGHMFRPWCLADKRFFGGQQCAWGKNSMQSTFSRLEIFPLKLEFFQNLTKMTRVINEVGDWRLRTLWNPNWLPQIFVVRILQGNQTMRPSIGSFA